MFIRVSDWHEQIFIVSNIDLNFSFQDNRNGASYSATNNRTNYYHHGQQQQQQRTHNNNVSNSTWHFPQ